MEYLKIDENIWLNKITKEEFTTKTFRDVDGKKFNFLDKENTFINGKYGKKYVETFFNTINNVLPTLETEEIICSNFIEPFKDKKIVVVGGGPSSSMVDLSSYEYFISSNYSFTKRDKINFLTLTPHVNLEDKNLHDFLLKNEKTIIGLEPEFLKTHEQKSVRQFYNTYKNRIFMHHTRFSSCLGISCRQIVMCILLGAKEVHFCGVDSYKNNRTTDHYFENKKEVPKWRQQNGVEFQNRQIIAFWEYVLEISKRKNCIVKNLSQELDVNCFGFITKEMK